MKDTKLSGKFCRHTRPVTGLAEDIRLNKSLWHLAEALRIGNLPAVVGAQN
jgi:hypothetical protein